MNAFIFSKNVKVNELIFLINILNIGYNIDNSIAAINDEERQIKAN